MREDTGETMRVCIVCPVRKGTPELVFDHVAELEKNEDNSVFFPPRDIPKTTPESDICQRMLMELDLADEIHVYYSGSSQGVHFDMGVLFVLQSEVPRRVKWLNPPVYRQRHWWQAWLWPNRAKSPQLEGYEAVLKEICHVV